MTTRPRINCPGCTSEQPFPERQRIFKETEEGAVLDVYISCTVCPWERALRFSTPRLEELRVLEARVKRNARSQIAMSGSPSITSRTLMRRISEERSEEASKLARMLSTSQEAI